MIILDSGLGGISVARALRTLAPQCVFHYLADTAGFPYGERDEISLCARAISLVEAIRTQVPEGPIVLACNTLSTLCLAALRASFPQRVFVGTVPAIKTASSFSKTRRFTLLSTPNTAQSEYSQQLVQEFASDCVVDFYGAPNLARYVEHWLLGGDVTDAQLRGELAPAFFDDASGRTDAVVLGCTHYPLMVERLAALVPWQVRWIDSSEAIAKRALSLVQPSTLGATPPDILSTAFVTNAEDVNRYRDVFAREGFKIISTIGT